MKEAQFYKRINHNTLSCRLCHHFCTLNIGETGVCNSRANIDGQLFSLNYGRPAAINIDPIEKKPFYHFYPGTLAFSLGTLGCNFSCKNCQNHEISQVQDGFKQNEKQDFLSPERIVEEALGNDCDSIAFTYTEPTISCEYTLEIMRLAHSAGLKNVWVSNAYMSNDCLDAIIPYLDAINVDLKSFDDSFYANNCQARLDPVLKNLVRLKQEQVHLEVTTLIIPKLSDDIDMLARMADFIATELDTDTPWHLSKFFPAPSWKLKDHQETSEDIIYEAYEIAKEAGIKYVYVGNLPGDQKANTHCPKCGEIAIYRLDYNIERHDLSGRCYYCDRSLDIIE